MTKAKKTINKRKGTSTARKSNGENTKKTQIKQDESAQIVKEVAKSRSRRGGGSSEQPKASRSSRAIKDNSTTPKAKQGSKSTRGEIKPINLPSSLDNAVEPKEEVNVPIEENIPEKKDEKKNGRKKKSVVENLVLLDANPEEGEEAPKEPDSMKVDMDSDEKIVKSRRRKRAEMKSTGGRSKTMTKVRKFVGTNNSEELEPVEANKENGEKEKEETEEPDEQVIKKEDTQNGEEIDKKESNKDIHKKKDSNKNNNKKNNKKENKLIELIKEKKEETKELIENKKEGIIENEKEESVEKSKEIIENKKEDITENKEEETTEDKKEEAIEDKKEEAIEDKKEETIEDKKEETIENNKEETIENKKVEGNVEVAILENNNEINSEITAILTNESLAKERSSGRRKKTTPRNTETQKTIQKQSTQRIAHKPTVQRSRKGTPRKSNVKINNKSRIEDANESKEKAPDDVAIVQEENKLPEVTVEVHLKENEKEPEKATEKVEKAPRRRSTSQKARVSKRRVNNKIEKDSNINNNAGREEEQKLDENKIEKVEIDKNNLEREEASKEKNEKTKQDEHNIEKMEQSENKIENEQQKENTNEEEINTSVNKELEIEEPVVNNINIDNNSVNEKEQDMNDMTEIDKDANEKEPNESTKEKEEPSESVNEKEELNESINEKEVLSESIDEKKELNESGNEKELSESINEKEERNETVNDKEELDENINEKAEIHQSVSEKEVHENIGDTVEIDKNIKEEKGLNENVINENKQDENISDKVEIDESVNDEEVDNTVDDKEKQNKDIFDKVEIDDEPKDKQIEIDRPMNEKVEFSETINEKVERDDKEIHDNIEIDNNIKEKIEIDKSDKEENNSSVLKNHRMNKKCETRYFDSISLDKPELGEILDREDFYGKKVSQTTIDNCLNDQEEILTDGALLLNEEPSKDTQEKIETMKIEEVKEEEVTRGDMEMMSSSFLSSDNVKLKMAEEGSLKKQKVHSVSPSKKDRMELHRDTKIIDGMDTLDEKTVEEEISSTVLVDKKKRGRKRKELKNDIDENSPMSKVLKIGKIHKRNSITHNNVSEKKESVKENGPSTVLCTSPLTTSEDKYKYFSTGVHNAMELLKGKDSMKKSVSGGEYVQLKEIVEEKKEEKEEEKEKGEENSINKDFDSLVPDAPLHVTNTPEDITIENQPRLSIQTQDSSIPASTPTRKKFRDSKEVGSSEILPAGCIRKKRRSHTGRRKYVRKNSRSRYEMTYNGNRSRKMSGDSLIDYKSSSVSRMSGKMINKNRLFPKENFMSKFEFMNNMNYINTVFHFDVEFFHFLNTVKNCNDINYESMLNFLNEIQVMLMKDIHVEYPHQCLKDHNVKDTVYVMKHLVRILNSNNAMLSMLNHLEFKFFKDFLRKRKEREEGISMDTHIQAMCEITSPFTLKEYLMQCYGIYNEEGSNVEGNVISRSYDTHKDSFDMIVECVNNEMDHCIQKTLKEEEEQKENSRNECTNESIDIPGSLTVEQESNEIQLHKQFVSTKVYKNITVVQPQVSPPVPPPQIHHLPQLRTFSLRGVHNTITASMNEKNEKNEKKEKKEEHTTGIKKEEKALYGASEFSKFEDLFRKTNDIQIIHEENETTRSCSNEKNILYSMETLRTYEDIEAKDRILSSTNCTQHIKEAEVNKAQYDNIIEENEVKIDSNIEKENSRPIDKCDSEQSPSNNILSVKFDDVTDTLPSIKSERDGEDSSIRQSISGGATASESTYTNLKNELLSPDTGKERIFNTYSDSTHPTESINPNTLYTIHSKNMSICNDNSIMNLLKETFHLEEEGESSNNLKNEKTEKEILECLNMISKIKKTLFDECTRMINNEIIRLEKNFKIINCGLSILNNNTTTTTTGSCPK